MIRIEKKNTPYFINCIFDLFYCIYVFLQKKLTNCNDYNKNINSTVDESITNGEREYDCTFTQTYRVVNLLDNYVAEVPELSYVILDKYQTHIAISHIIPANLKTKLETNKYYEFTYHIKGKGYIRNMDDIYQQISSTEIYNQSDEKAKKEIYKDKEMFVYLTITETNKEGLEQINESICE